MRRLTEATDRDGVLDPGGSCGPRLGRFPTDPHNGKSIVRIDTPSAGADTDGWHFSSSTLLMTGDDLVSNGAP